VCWGGGNGWMWNGGYGGGWSKNLIRARCEGPVRDLVLSSLGVVSCDLTT
jgi:hypothetical protein